MLEHLLDADPALFVEAEKLGAAAEVDAKFASAMLSDDEVVVQGAQKELVQQAFAALTAGEGDAQKAAVAKLESPAAVKRLVGMLTQYDWEFVERAKDIRNFLVGKLLDETEHPDGKVRLRAYELLGKVTEVALFTERHEVKHTSMSDAELDKVLRERLEQYARAERVVEGVQEPVLEDEKRAA